MAPVYFSFEGYDGETVYCRQDGDIITTTRGDVVSNTDTKVMREISPDEYALQKRHDQRTQSAIFKKCRERLPKAKNMLASMDNVLTKADMDIVLGEKVMTIDWVVFLKTYRDWLGINNGIPVNIMSVVVDYDKGLDRHGLHVVSRAIAHSISNPHAKAAEKAAAAAAEAATAKAAKAAKAARKAEAKAATETAAAIVLQRAVRAMLERAVRAMLERERAEVARLLEALKPYVDEGVYAELTFQPLCVLEAKYHELQEQFEAERKWIFEKNLKEKELRETREREAAAQEEVAEQKRREHQERIITSSTSRGDDASLHPQPLGTRPGKQTKRPKSQKKQNSRRRGGGGVHR
jgi:hypothetical protein